VTAHIPNHIHDNNRLMKNDIAIDEDLITTPEGKIFFRRWSPRFSTQPPIVLLHDSLGCVDLWHDFPRLLALNTHHPVIAYDRLGFGRSSIRHKLPGVNFISEEAENFFPKLREALDLTSFILFGHSVGGAMALMIAASHTSACNGVITEAAQAFVEKRTLAGIQQAKLGFQRPEQFDRLIKWHGDKAQWVLEAWTDIWLSDAFSTWSIAPFLGKVLCPVMAIHGDLDEFGSTAFPECISKGVHGLTQMIILENCGHVPHREQQQQIIQLVHSFIKRHCTIS